MGWYKGGGWFSKLRDCVVTLKGDLDVGVFGKVGDFPDAW
jgi:hypothetical protein